MGKARGRSSVQTLLLIGGGVLSPPAFDALGVGRLVVRPLAGVIWARLFFGVVIALMVAGFVYGRGDSDALDLVVPVLVFLGAVLVFAVLSLVPKRLVAELGERDAIVVHRGLLGSGRWTAPIASFDGVAWRSNRPAETDSDQIGEAFSKSAEALRLFRRATSYQWIELVHPDPRKTLVLHFQSGEIDMKNKIELYSRRLERPIIT